MKPFVVKFEMPSGKIHKAVYMAKTSTEARNYFLVQNRGFHFVKVEAEPIDKGEDNAKKTNRA